VRGGAKPAQPKGERPGARAERFQETAEDGVTGSYDDFRG